MPEKRSELKETRSLRQLAHFAGVQIWYFDMAHRRREASPESLLAVLQSLGLAVRGVVDCADALREERLADARRVIEPVVVAWDRARAGIPIRFPRGRVPRRARLSLHLESGEVLDRDICASQLPVERVWRSEDAWFEARRIELPARLPLGYHLAVLDIPQGHFESLIVAAPRTAFSPEHNERRWGVVLPLYALHSASSWGSGDFGDLRKLIEWTANRGGGLVGTLPLLPAFLEEPFDPSPYSPVSRLLWNEFYLDLERIPELANCSKAKALLRSTAFQREVKSLRATSQVDYRRQWALKRKVLETLAQWFFAGNSARRAELKRFLRKHPLVADYARFRAVVEKQKNGWRHWPERMRRGTLQEGDYDEMACRCHLYSQWLAHEQMAALTHDAGRREVELYLDLPLGVHADGFDTWRHREIFALEAHGGAPPDLVFTNAQDWGFAPLHPQRLRETGYRYFIEVLRHHLSHAGILRIDHVMGLHRLYWIPRGLAATEGAYVTYPAEELYAILCLESQRHKALIVGENLGTVPPEVNRRMAQHKVRGMFVVQCEVRPEPQAALRTIPAMSVASLNTHDMWPFKAFWQGLDIVDQQKLGFLKRAGVRPARQRRERMKRALIQFLRRRAWVQASTRDVEAALKGMLSHLAASSAEVLLLNLEDLWLETEPQNVPSTLDERVNWRRKTRFGREQIEGMSKLQEVIERINQLRRETSL